MFPITSSSLKAHRYIAFPDSETLLDKFNRTVRPTETEEKIILTVADHFGDRVFREDCIKEESDNVVHQFNSNLEMDGWDLDHLKERIYNSLLS